VFACPRLDKERKDLLGPRKPWEELDLPNWRKNGREDSFYDTIEVFFDFIYSEFS